MSNTKDVPRLGKVVRAAGGVIWRRRDDDLEVVLIHRPQYDDWSLPKGKVDRRETHKDAALRETFEETGLRCALGPKLDVQEYPMGNGRWKRVKYWLMEPVEGSVDDWHPNREVDEVIWISLVKARRKATYGVDRDLLDAAADALAGHL